MKKTLLLTASLFAFFFAHAQEGAPTLSFGLDQVLFGKGTLDVELIAEIIADKQDELKKRIVEKEILEPMFENSSFTTRNYVFSVVKNLMYEKDKNVLKKEILEHTANYALVYTLAEMYTQYSWGDLKKSKENYFTELNISGYSFNQVGLNRIQSFNPNDYVKFKLGLSDSLFIVSKCNCGDPDCNSEKCCEDECLRYNDVLIDMIFHAVRSNNVFITKGFNNKPLYFNNDLYRSLSFYQRLPNGALKDLMYKDIEGFVKDIADNYQNFEDVLAFSKKTIDATKETLKDEIDLLKTTSNKIALQFLQDQKNQISSELNTGLENQKVFQKILIKLDNLSKEKFGKIITSTNRNDLDEAQKQAYDSLLTSYNNTKSALDELGQKLNILNNNFRDVTHTIQKLVPESIGLGYATIFSNIQKSLQQTKLDRQNFDNLPQLDSIIQEVAKIYYLYSDTKQINGNKKWLLNKIQNELLPNLTMINIYSENNVFLDSLIAHIDQLRMKIDLDLKEKLSATIKNPNISTQFRAMLEDHSGMIGVYLSFLQRLDDLDKTETYYYLLKNILMAGDHLNNEKAAEAMRLILVAIDKYTSFDSEADRIDLDVESIILALFEKYGNRDRNKLNFYATVGVNNALTMYPSRNTLPADNFSFASEKIGLSFTLWNPLLRHSYSFRETKPYSYNRNGKHKDFDNIDKIYKTEPILSDIHLMVFGSGLLYQLTDLSTTKNMNSMFIGTGLGVTFFNNLSFNTSFMFPIESNKNFVPDAPMLNIGFDIYFTEYLTALNKKRQQNKKAKMELEELKIKTQYEETTKKKIALKQ